MSTTESTIKVYKTSDYDKFKFLEGNRNVDPFHVAQLIEKIKDKNLTAQFPIDVNEKFEVIDGQHRLAALKSLNLPVYYLVQENMIIDDVIELNTGSKNWNWRDYAVSYAERGNQEYKQFLELTDKFSLQFTTIYEYSTLGNAMTIGVGGRKGSHKNGTVDVFQNGNFKFIDRDFSEKLLAQYDELAHAIGQGRNRSLAHAALTYMRLSKYNHETFLVKAAKFAHRFDNCYTTDDFLVALDDVALL